MAAKPFSAKRRALLLPLMALALMGASKSCDEGNLGATFTFETDTVALGRPITAVGTIRYAEGYPLIPPDTARAYRPFELIRIDTLARAVPIDTLVDDEKPARRVVILADSLRWHLRSFSLDSVQQLALRYRIIDTTDGGRDTTTLTTSADSVRFVARWANPPPASAQPTFDFTQPELQAPFDWPGLFILLAVLGVVGALATWLLRQPVLRWLARRRLDRAHAQRLSDLTQLEARLATEPAEALIGINRLWQQHFAADTGLQLRALTARELAEQLPTTPLADAAPPLVALSAAEAQAAYAGRPVTAETVADALARLRALLADDYTRRRRALS